MDKIGLTGLIVAILTLALTSPIILEKYFSHPDFSASSYIQNDTLYISVYNNGLKEGAIQAAGYCYYQSGNCTSGLLRNLYELKFISPKSGTVFEVERNVSRNEIIQFHNGSFAVVLCQIGLGCDAYLSLNQPGCLQERTFINNGTFINLPDEIKKRPKKVKISSPTSYPGGGLIVNIDPEFQC